MAADLSSRLRLAASSLGHDSLAGLLNEAAAEIERMERSGNAREDYRPLVHPGSWLRGLPGIATIDQETA